MTTRWCSCRFDPTLHTETGSKTRAPPSSTRATDEPRSDAVPRPKAVDQPERTPYGTLTQNGRFYQAAQDYKDGRRPPERVRVYEKLRQGIWSVVCGSADELHFDHDLPYSKGGTSITEENVQLMCARHNLEKGAQII